MQRVPARCRDFDRNKVGEAVAVDIRIIDDPFATDLQVHAVIRLHGDRIGAGDRKFHKPANIRANMVCAAARQDITITHEIIQDQDRLAHDAGFIFSPARNFPGAVKLVEVVGDRKIRLQLIRGRLRRRRSETLNLVGCGDGQACTAEDHHRQCGKPKTTQHQCPPSGLPTVQFHGRTSVFENRPAFV